MAEFRLTLSEDTYSMKILHLDSSVTGEKSVSRPLTQEAAAKLKSLYPDAEYTYRDLIKEPLRHYTAVVRFYGKDDTNLSPEQQQELTVGEQLIEEFRSANVVIIGAPMYNFGIPSQLKAWIDHLAVPRVAFRYGPNGPEGLFGGKRVIVISSRGGLYGPGSPFEPFDFQEAYLRRVFEFFGITDVTVITAEGVGSPDKRDAALASAKAKIAELK